MSDTENTLHAHLKAGQLYTHISGHKIDKSHYRWESSDMYVDSIKISMLPLYFLIRTRQMTHHYSQNRLIFQLCIILFINFNTFTSKINSTILRLFYVNVFFKCQWFRSVEGFQYFSSLSVLHYLHAVLFIKIWTFFMNILYNSLKSGCTKDHFGWGKSTWYCPLLKGLSVQAILPHAWYVEPTTLKPN
jgi:hypothetical protein